MIVIYIGNMEQILISEFKFLSMIISIPLSMFYEIYKIMNTSYVEYSSLN